MTLLRRLIPDPFTLLLIATIAVAAVLPARGVAAIWVDHIATAAIIMLFFFYGAKIPREAAVAALRHWRLHVTILATSFAVFPLLGLGWRQRYQGF